MILFRSSTFAMIPLIWFYDTILSDIHLLWYDSVGMFCWIWYDMLSDMICSMPEFLFYPCRYHGHFLWRCDWSTASPFCKICIMWSLGHHDIYVALSCEQDICMILFCRGEGVWMHPRYVGYVGFIMCRVNVGVCFTLLHVWEVAPPFGT